MLKIDGFDDCILGISRRIGSDDILIYDPVAIVGKLMRETGMDCGEAWEYFEFNIAGAYMGEGTPCFLEDFDLETYQNEQQVTDANAIRECPTCAADDAMEKRKDDDFEAIDTERNLVNLKCIHPDCKPTGEDYEV